MNSINTALEHAPDLLIRNAKIFNAGLAPVIEDIAISNGRIQKRGKHLDCPEGVEVIDAEGQWAMPGLFDIHTHYDLELEVSPGLPESTRHGTTSVIIANCSLGLSFGAQRKDGADPIVDCYARVENIPKPVLRACADKVSWETPTEYLAHLDELPLGPNVGVLMPHSMLRIEAMGFEPSINRDPTPAELSEMQSVLDQSIADGYLGLSTDALPFHYLANQPNCHKTIPTQFANYEELKALTGVVRARDAVWQATPPKDSIVDTIKTFLLTSARLHGKALRTTVVAALDVASNRSIIRKALTLTRLLNGPLFKGSFHMQALGAPFKTWADGAITPLAEEIPELRALNETDLEDRAARQKILHDPDYIEAFKRMWLKGKSGVSIARLKRMLRIEDYAFNRTLSDMRIEVCPLECWQGRDMQSVYERVLSVIAGHKPDAPCDDETVLIQQDFAWVADEGDFMLQMLRSFDTDLSWSTINANRDPETTRKLLMDPLLIPGFNDSGAHVTNMAFYDVNLRCLKLAAQGGDHDVAYMVKRLTKDAADLFGVEGGTINEGDTADLILVNPAELKVYDGEAGVQRVHRAEYDHDQLVNRSDKVVPLVMIGGQVAWRNDAYTPELGEQKMGRVLRFRGAQ